MSTQQCCLVKCNLLQCITITTVYYVKAEKKQYNEAFRYTVDKIEKNKANQQKVYVTCALVLYLLFGHTCKQLKTKVAK